MGGEPLSSRCPHNYGSPQARLLLLAMHKVHALSEQPRELALQLAKANLPRMSPECVCCISSSCPCTAAIVDATTSPPATVADITTTTATTVRHHRHQTNQLHQHTTQAHGAPWTFSHTFFFFFFFPKKNNKVAQRDESNGALARMARSAVRLSLTCLTCLARARLLDDSHVAPLSLVARSAVRLALVCYSQLSESGGATRHQPSDTSDHWHPHRPCRCAALEPAHTEPPQQP
jgi:hypothetical protein